MRFSMSRAALLSPAKSLERANFEALAGVSLPSPLDVPSSCDAFERSDPCDASPGLRMGVTCCPRCPVCMSSLSSVRRRMSETIDGLRPEEGLSDKPPDGTFAGVLLRCVERGRNLLASHLAPLSWGGGGGGGGGLSVKEEEKRTALCKHEPFQTQPSLALDARLESEP